MGDLLLVRLDPAITKTLENDAEYLEAAGQGDWPRVAGVVQRVLGRTLEADPVSVDQLDWGGYYAVDAGTREVVGSCAFKAPRTMAEPIGDLPFRSPGSANGNGFVPAWSLVLPENPFHDRIPACPEVRPARIDAHVGQERRHVLIEEGVVPGGVGDHQP